MRRLEHWEGQLEEGGRREGVEEDREQKNEGVKIVEGVAIFGK